MKLSFLLLSILAPAPVTSAPVVTPTPCMDNPEFRFKQERDKTCDGLPKSHSIAVRRNGRELTFPIIVLVLVVCVNRARLLPALPQDHLPPLPPGHLPPLPAQLLLDVTRSSVSTTQISSTKIVGSLIASGLPKRRRVAVTRRTTTKGSPSSRNVLNLALLLNFAWTLHQRMDLKGATVTTSIFALSPAVSATFVQKLPAG